jgi:hypothetical protein
MCFNTHVDAPAPRNLAQETQDTLATQIRLAPEQLAAYQATAPGYAATDVSVLGQSLFGPDFTGNLSDINRRLTDEAATQSQEANTAQRKADIADVQSMSGAVTAAQRAANPELFGNLDALDAAAAGGITPGAAENAFGAAAMQSSPRFTARDVNFTGVRAGRVQPGAVSNSMTNPDGPSAIESALQTQALSDLGQGDQLSADEARLVRVQSRAAADSRGRGYSNAALADEVLNTAQARQARLDSRRTFATGVNSALRSGQAADRSYGLAKDSFRSGIDQFNVGNRLAADQFNVGNRLGADQFNSTNSLASQQFNSQMGLNAAGFNASRTDADRAALDRAAQLEAARRGEEFSRQLSATQARLSTFSDPFQGVLGRSSSNAGSNANLFGNATGTAGASAATTRGMFDPYNAYASDLYNTNYNGSAAAGIANANNNTALLGGLIGTAGKLGGAGIAAGMFCWLARAVYGRDDSRWLAVRKWMLAKAPAHLLAAYAVNGRKAAARARVDSAYRSEIKALFDAVLALNPQIA